jgi:hypothetical protein
MCELASFQLDSYVTIENTANGVVGDARQQIGTRMCVVFT